MLLWASMVQACSTSIQSRPDSTIRSASSGPRPTGAAVDADRAADGAQPPDVRVAHQGGAGGGGHDLVRLEHRRVARAAAGADRVRDGQQGRVDPVDEARVQRSGRHVAQHRAGKGHHLDRERPGGDGRDHAPGRDARDEMTLGLLPGRARPVREQVGLARRDEHAVDRADPFPLRAGGGHSPDRARRSAVPACSDSPFESTPSIAFIPPGSGVRTRRRW